MYGDVTTSDMIFENRFNKIKKKTTASFEP